MLPSTEVGVKLPLSEVGGKQLLLEVGVEPLLSEVGVERPLSEVGVKRPLSEVGVALLSLVMRVMLTSSLSLFESLPRRKKPEKVSKRLVSIRRVPPITLIVPPITLIQSKEDKMEKMEEHFSLNASVCLKLLKSKGFQITSGLLNLLKGF